MRIGVDGIDPGASRSMDDVGISKTNVFCDDSRSRNPEIKAFMSAAAVPTLSSTFPCTTEKPRPIVSKKESSSAASTAAARGSRS